MEYSALRLAKIHREVIEQYYTPVCFESKQMIDYDSNIQTYITCAFCDDAAEINHYIPALETFHKWVSESKLELLAQYIFTLTPACKPCSTLLNKSSCLTLDDQRDYIRASRNGTIKRKV